MKYLITGGTGSFGRAFTERLLQDKGTERVVVLSRGEHAQAEMASQVGDQRVRYFIGDVRDRVRLVRAFHGIDVVVHAAALKRIEVGFYNPSEMVATNIGGATNTIEAALDAQVKKVVFTSSDKAYQPISPYGQSKALAETLFRNAYQHGCKFAVTRYGNVWGSRGSVVPRWAEALQRTDTVDITDPEATRFFMRMSQAVQLVVDAIKNMKGGDLFIPTLPAYRLGDLTEAMGAKVRVIGLPEWEKLHEGMCDGNTSDKARRMSVAELREVLDESGLHRAGQNGVKAPTRQSFTATQRTLGYRRGADPLSGYHRG